MTKIYRQGAIGALLDEYERAIDDLQQVITDISDVELATIVDNKTNDARCKSVQTILSHVVSAGRGYAVYIRQLKGQKIDYPGNIFHQAVNDYKKDLDQLFIFTVDTFKDINENDLEQFDNDKKIKAFWGQVYDIEQITEHAIVHILRHRRQIEKFKIVLRGQKSKDIRDRLGIRIEGIQTILSVKDMNTSRVFYKDILGFEEVEWGTDDFTSVNRENAGIYLCKEAQGNPGTWIWVGFDGDIFKLHDDLRAKGVKIRKAPTNYSWAMEMQIEDPDGHVLRFGTDPVSEPF